MHLARIGEQGQRKREPETCQGGRHRPVAHPPPHGHLDPKPDGHEGQGGHHEAVAPGLKSRLNKKTLGLD